MKRTRAMNSPRPPSTARPGKVSAVLLIAVVVVIVVLDDDPDGYFGASHAKAAFGRYWPETSPN